MMTEEEIHAVHVAAYHDRRVPMPAHVSAAFATAVPLARQAGASFVRGAVEVWAYAGRADEPSVTFFTDRPILIYLNVGQPGMSAREWTRHVLHELAHAFFDSRQDIGYVQREDRADRFAARALEG